VIGPADVCEWGPFLASIQAARRIDSRARTLYPRYTQERRVLRVRLELLDAAAAIAEREEPSLFAEGVDQHAGDG